MIDSSLSSHWPNEHFIWTPPKVQPLRTIRAAVFLGQPTQHHSHPSQHQSQRNITSVLNALENRIFLLRETNATLEAIAQALFKSWFVDFDPVRAKMEGRVQEGMDDRLDQSIETGVYRIVQELFSNILKHAKAQHIVVQLNHVEGSLNITVEDDGVGFNV